MSQEPFEQLIALAQAFYQSSWMSFLKFFLGVYTLVLLINIILLIISRNPLKDVSIVLKGVSMPVASRDAMQKRWLKIKDRLETKNLSQFKVAVLEADLVLDEVLGSIGIEGKNLTEKLEKIKPAQLAGYEEIKKAHFTRNRIVHEADFFLDEKTTREIIAVYKKALKSLELL